MLPLVQHWANRPCPILDLNGHLKPSQLSGLKQPLALSSPVPTTFGQLLGPTTLSFTPTQELPGCLGLTPNLLTPALAGNQALLNLQRYLLS